MIYQIAVPTPLRKTFEYLALSTQSCAVGSRVFISFGRRKVVGVVLGLVDQSEFPIDKLKTIEAVIDEASLLDEKLLALYHWASEYYHHPIGDVIVGTFPKKVREGVSVNVSVSASLGTASSLALTAAQEDAVSAILATRKFEPFLLAGVTGSGKTEVYLRVIEKVIQNKQQALVLVPEISLTPQTVQRFQERFSVPVLLLHSGLTDKQRYVAWMQATQAEPCIVIGTRSAVFAPLRNLGVIVVDEEHDISFKQQSGFRYSARDTAMMRAKLCNIPIVLGTATPALETWKNVTEKKYTLLTLSHRVGNAVLPEIIVHDVRRKKLHAGLSTELITLMQMHLKQGNQVLLFLNRRGYAPVLLCHQCGFLEKCKRCDARLTLHDRPRSLHCHHCGYAKVVPKICGQCEQGELLTLGVGTEQLETQLTTVFPDKKILRVDRDSITTFKKLEQALQKIHTHEADIIVGTQMLVKGHHFENVTLVAVIDVDQALFSSDFRAIERLGQSLIQVAGRAGRAEKKGEVFIQTHHPDHPLLEKLLRDNYAAFSKALLEDRSKAVLPPYAHMALFRAEGKSRESVQHFLGQLQKNMGLMSEVNVAGPFPLAMERLAGKYRAQLLFQAQHRGALKNAIARYIGYLETQKKQSAIRWYVDIDPLEV